MSRYFAAYATYDLTNLATLRDWPLPPDADRHRLGHGGQRRVGGRWQGRTGLEHAIVAMTRASYRPRPFVCQRTDARRTSD